MFTSIAPPGLDADTVSQQCGAPYGQQAVGRDPLSTEPDRLLSCPLAQPFPREVMVVGLTDTWNVVDTGCYEYQVHLLDAAAGLPFTCGRRI